MDLNLSQNELQTTSSYKPYVFSSNTVPQETIFLHPCFDREYELKGLKR